MAISHAFSNAIADGTNTQIVRPSDWNSAHNFQQDIAGNTAGVSSVSGTNIVWAGGNNVTLSANGQTISVIAGSAAPSPVNVSAGTTSGDLGTVVFADSNGVSFGLNGSTITATVATNYQSQGAYLTTAALSNHSHGNPTLNLTNLSGTTASNSAGFTLSLSAVAALTTAAVSNHSHGNPTLNLTNLSGTTASNSAGFTLSLSAVNALTTAALSNHSHGDPTLALTNLSGTTASNSAGFTLSLSAVNALTTAALSNHSHGNPTLALTNISGTTASNSAGLTLSLSAGAAGGGAGNTASYYANAPLLGLAGLTGISGSSKVVAPFVVPMPVSADFMRVFVSVASNSTTRATSANTTVSMSRATTLYGVIYSQGAGASSLSLQSVASASVLSGMVFSLSANANGSEYTVSQSITYPSGSGATAEYTTTYATTQTNFAVFTTNLTNFSAVKVVDLPFSTLLAGSNYWAAFGQDTAVKTVENTAWANWVFSNNRFYAYTNLNSTIGVPGVAAPVSMGAEVGLGLFSTNSIGTIASIPLTAVSSLATNPAVNFQLHRFA